MYNPLFAHGDDSYRFSAPIVADFSSNVWMGGTSAELLAYLGEKLSVVGNYPQLHAETLAGAYARQHQVNEGQVLVTNGTAEAIFLIACHFQNGHSAIAIPTFSEYEHACGVYRHSLDFVSVEELPLVQKTLPGLFWICHPNNPTGHSFELVILEDLVRNNPQTVFVIDEAYIELCLSQASLLNVINEHPNLIVLRSMTKHHAIPGLRLGYMVGEEGLIRSVSAHQPPWSVNAMAIEAGHFLLNHPTDIDVSSFMVRARQLQEAIENSTGWRSSASSAAYFLMEAPVPAAYLKQLLIDRYGILIRDASNFRGLSAYHFRICPQSDDKNQLLVMALRELKNVRV